MSNSSPKKVYQKSLLMQTEELVSALLIIRDCRKEVLNKDHLLIPIYGQLRALLSRKGRNNALLFRLLERYKIEAVVYRLPLSSEDPNAPDVLKEAVMNFGICPISLEKTLQGQVQSSLDELLKAKCIKSGDTYIEIETVIKYFAEKAGGAHYDVDVPEDDLIIHSIVPQTELISNLCDVVTDLGEQIVRKMNDLDAYISLVFPEQEFNSEATLTDQIVPNTLLRIKLSIKNKVLHLHLSDSEGRMANLSSNCEVPIGKRFIINYSIKILPNLEQLICLASLEISERNPGNTHPPAYQRLATLMQEVKFNDEQQVQAFSLIVFHSLYKQHGVDLQLDSGVLTFEEGLFDALVAASRNDTL